MTNLEACPECGHALDRIHNADGCTVCDCTYKGAPVTPTVSPLARIVRTVLQVILAVAAAIGAAVALLGFSAVTAAKITGIAGALVVIVTAVQNALEKAGLIPTVGASADTKSPLTQPWASITGGVLSGQSIASGVMGANPSDYDVTATIASNGSIASNTHLDLGDIPSEAARSAALYGERRPTPAQVPSCGDVKPPYRELSGRQVPQTRDVPVG